MELGVRNNCIAGSSLQEKIEIVKELGFDFLELALSQEEIKSLDTSTQEYYLNMAQRNNFPIKQTSMGHFTSFADKSPAARKEIIEDIKKVIDFNKALSGDIILLACREESEEVNSFAEIYQKELLPAADYAQTNGVNLALEGVGHYKLSLIEKLVRAIDHPAVGMYFDIGNCIYGGEDPVQQLQHSVDIVTALHIKGTDNKPLAQMPLSEIKEILENNDYQGRGCLEIPPQEENSNFHLLKAIKILEKIGY